MSDKTFVDTNVLIYAHDVDAARKHEIAKDLLRTLWLESDLAAAFQVEDQARIGFWDALIVAVAARAGARRVLSEDLNNGQSIAGLSIHNPFKEKAPPKPRR